MSAVPPSATSRPSAEEIEDLALRLEIDYREHRYQNCQRAASMLRRCVESEIKPLSAEADAVIKELRLQHFAGPLALRAEALIRALSVNATPVSATTRKHGRRVVCAAVRAADGAILLGVRHYSADMHQQISERYDGAKFSHRHDEDQGFIDQHGVFLSREEAYCVAEEAGQIVRPDACGDGLKGKKLYSEGLY